MIATRIFSPVGTALAVRDGLLAIHRNGGLVLHMTVRELHDRYAGQMLGIAWTVGTPLLAMATYVFAFTFIFRQRLGADDAGNGYTAYVLAGLVPWLAITDVLSRAPSAVSTNASLVKQIVFPSEVLPLRVALASIPQLMVGLAVVLLISAIAGRLHFHAIVLLPAAVVIYVLTMAGVAYVFAAIGVFIKDVREIVTFATSIGLFLHPVLYSPASTPKWLLPIFYISPASHLVWCFRDALIEEHIIHPWSWLVASVFAIFVFATGWRFYRMLQPSFGNAL
ncbi:ABC transporter permease [Bradyrhizobium arachidis]|uniref:ABC transporter permease n=1 Tax=Bradyrhizobium arachidis TaxID=858423 RepID=UPI002162A0FC|nr:ABC transporter permease [Bradyrhizobium arachidis]